MAKLEYKIVAAELWGNAKDGFDTNDWHTLKRWTRYKKPHAERYLLAVVRDCFEGRSFAWSEASSRPMSRKGITLDWHGAGEGNWLVMYRGHYVGEVTCSYEHTHIRPDTKYVEYFEGDKADCSICKLQSVTVLESSP